MADVVTDPRRHKTHPWFLEQVAAGKLSGFALRDGKIVQTRPWSEPARTPRRRFLSPADVDSMEDPVWRIENLIPAGRKLVDIYGRPGGGKSKLAREWAFAVALGRPWIGRATRQGPVFYIHAEGLDEVKWWKAAWAEREGIGMAEVNAAPIWFLPEAENFLSKENITGLIEDIRLVHPEPAVVVIDTRARAFEGGDESDGLDMGKFVSHVGLVFKSFPNPDVWTVTHPGKDRRRGVLGHSKYSAAMDGQVYLTQMSGDKEVSGEVLRGAGPRTLLIKKIRGSKQPPEDTIPLELMPDGLFAAGEEGQKSGVLGRTEEKRIAEIVDALKGGPLNWTDLLKASKQSESTFRRYLGQAQEKGRVVKKDGLYSLPSPPPSPPDFLPPPATQ